MLRGRNKKQRNGLHLDYLRNGMESYRTVRPGGVYLCGSDLNRKSSNLARTLGDGVEALGWPWESCEIR